jgi:fluoroacetyl-CoA thioesterase
MPNDLRPGLTHKQTLRVDNTLTVPFVSKHFSGFGDMPPVFATAFMVGFVEWACIEALKAHLTENEQTVGTHIDISHIAPTPVGFTVSANVTLTEVNDRALTFLVECFDNAGPIGRGMHKRTIIDKARFAAKLVEKAKSVSR